MKTEVWKAIISAIIVLFSFLGMSAARLLIRNEFFESIITVNGIFIGLTVIYFSLVRFALASSTMRSIKEAVLYLTVSDWLTTVSLFLFSILISFLGLLSPSELAWLWAFVAFASMWIGIINFLLTVTEHVFVEEKS